MADNFQTVSRQGEGWRRGPRGPNQGCDWTGCSGYSPVGCPGRMQQGECLSYFKTCFKYQMEHITLRSLMRRSGIFGKLRDHKHVALAAGLKLRMLSQTLCMATFECSELPLCWYPGPMSILPSRWWLILMMRRDVHQGCCQPELSKCFTEAMFFWPTLSQLRAAGALAADAASILW